MKIWLQEKIQNQLTIWIIKNKCHCFTAVVLISKSCINVAFSGCSMHFSHITASPYAKWLNADLSYGSLEAAISLNTTCNLSVIKDHIATQLYDLWCHLSNGPALDLSSTHCKSSQWRAESGWCWNKGKSYHNFQTILQHPPPPPPLILIPVPYKIPKHKSSKECYL